MDITSFVTRKRVRALQVGDYNSYRGQLSRQLLSLRRRLGRTTPNKAKYTKKAEITVEDIQGNHEYIHYLLIQAERAWAHAMHIKSTHTADSASRGISGPTRSHIISKLHKAFTYSSHLVTLLSDRQGSKSTDNAFLEATAYALCLSGSEEFEKQATKRYDDPEAQKKGWSKCLANFSEAHVIYTALLFSTKKELFKEVLAETVDPSLRVAAVQSKIQRTIPIPTVAKQHFHRDHAELLALVEKLNPNALSKEQTQVTTSKDGTSTLDIPTTIKWRERTAPIVDAAIGQAMAATSIATSNLASLFASTKGPRPKGKSRSKTATSPRALAAAYDPVLNGAQETVDAVRQAISDLQKEGVSESDQRMQDLRVSDLATNYTLISWRIGRNRVLVSGSTGDDGASFALETPRDRGKKDDKTISTDKTDTDGEDTQEDDDSVLHPTSARRHKAPKKSKLLSHLRERDVLYDATLQSLDSILVLRGASNSPDFLAEIAQKRDYFQALKCLNIGRSHNIVGSANAKQALALFARAAAVLNDAFPDLARSSADITMTDAASSSSSATGPPTLNVTPAQLAALHRTLAHTVFRQRGLVALHQYTAAAPSTTTTTTATTEPTEPPLIAALHAYPATVDLRNIVTYPPRLQPVPVKPIFLDLAWNYIEYPGRPSRDDDVAAPAAAVPAPAAAVEQETRTEEPEQPTGRRRGWFGFGRT